MSDPVNVTGGLSPVTISVPTSTSSEATVKDAVINILEMEDVLFHLDSAVMMPDKPAGKSSTDGTEDDATNPGDQAIQQKQEQACGLNMLTLVFKESEFNPDQRLLIAGHTDTSGGYALNYTLSEQRAQNVLFLLLGADPGAAEPAEEGEAWATVCAARHKIEDYQQILAHFCVRGDLSPACHPLGSSNSWNDQTEAACNAFFNERIPDSVKVANIKQQVKTDSQHKWPVEAWRAVYDLYVAQLRLTMSLTSDQLQAKRKVLAAKFSKEHPYVACGESYPIENVEQDNYRSQKNRRVEVLFVEEKMLQNINCPKDTNRKHKTRLDDPPIECPLWHQFIKRVYVDPANLYAEMYHIRLLYWDRVLSKLAEVPSGLIVEAYRDGTKINTETRWKNGVYWVKVLFPGPLPPTPPADFHFEFKTVDQWIYTGSSTDTPAIVTKTEAAAGALKPEDRWKHHDLPKHWNSKGFTTRYNCTLADVTSGADLRDDYLPVVKDKLSLKPYGNAVTASTAPLTFCLEDIVLTNQVFAPIPDAKGEGALLGTDFEVIDPDVGNKKEYYSKNGVPSRRIPFTGKRIFGVLFNRRLYAVYQDRISDPALAGHRAAVFLHPKRCTLVTNFQQRHYRDYHNIGNFDAYLLRMVDFRNGRQISYIYNYFRWHCEDATAHTPYAQDWVNSTFKNLTNEWNDAANNQLVSLLYEKNSDDIHQVNIRFYLEQVTKPNQHTIIMVHPSGTPGRSSMGKEKGQIRANQNVRDGNGRFTAAHEFGHAQSLDDDYHEKWNNCCYWQMGFVDFKPGAPFIKDAYGMMQSNMTVRSRYYWHFAVWCNKEFIPKEKCEFSVIKKNEDDYKLMLDAADSGDPRDMAKDSRTYCNYPAKTLRNTKNEKSGKGTFDLHLYPLGPDPYSKGGLKSGLNFTGIIILPVNLRFKFWNSANYDDIVGILDKIDTGIQKNLINKMALKVKGSKPYEETFIVPQPRYLVDNFTAGQAVHLNKSLNTSAKYAAYVAWITAKPEAKTHYHVEVKSPFLGLGSTSWSGSKLELVKNDAGKFWRYFCEMLGLSHKELPTKDNFSVAAAVPGGIMESC